jgi:endonuclease YncB( thermonuclease family)
MLSLALLLNLTGAVAIDGDTLKLDGQRYRLWGIDAPERDEAGGTEATLALRAIIEGQRLSCDALYTDPYQRPVVRCTLPDGSDPSCTLVARGHAEDWPKYSKGHYAACE